MAIKTKLEDLLDAINEVTGQERTDLTDAVQDLVDGYGQGGGSESPTIIGFDTLPNYFNFPCFSPTIVHLQEVEE